MQTDILLKQLNSSLEGLKTAIDKFEKHPTPSTQYAEELHLAIQQSNKMVSAYLVLKEQKDVSPELNLHLKLMNVPVAEEKKAIIEPVKESVVIEPTATTTKEEAKPIEVAKEFIVENSIVPVAEIKSIAKELPKIAININDKFRFINELFASNTNEYNIAIEQINAVSSMEELNNYLKGLKSIYEWKDDNEVVKNLYSLAQKRFS
jgi:hypothetical protein